MRPHVALFLGLYIASYLLTLLLGLLNPAPLANIFGLISLMLYMATLLPSLLKVVVPSLKRSPMTVWLLKYRRHVGVAAYGFGLNHGILLAVQRQLNFLDWHTYIHYCQGLATITIFTLLTLTSNDESMKALKKGWKKLHQLTYLAIFILPWHILDKMAGHWSRLTPIAVTLSFALVVLFLRRRWLEWNPTGDRTLFPEQLLLLNAIIRR